MIQLVLCPSPYTIHLPHLLHMTSYHPYRFLPGQQPPPSSTVEQIHIPVYAEPDLDPGGPLPGAQRDDSSSSHPQSMTDQVNDNEAGPSRKRPRQSESGGMTGDANSHGAAQMEELPRHRPVPLSMFSFDARNDLTREIGNWLVRTCQGRENIEVSPFLMSSVGILTSRLKSS